MIVYEYEKFAVSLIFTAMLINETCVDLDYIAKIEETHLLFCKVVICNTTNIYIFIDSLRISL